VGHHLTTLPSGVTVVTEPMPSVRSATVGMWVAVGSRDEAPGEAGASHLLEHLLFKGTGRRSAREIAEAIDGVGGEMNAFTTKEVTCFHARVLARDLPVAFEVLADMLVDARNADEDVEAEREVVLSELDVHHDSPGDLVHCVLEELVFGDHPLAADPLGTVASVASLDRARIHRHYLDSYRPESLVVAAAGDVDHDRLVGLAERWLGDLSRPGGRWPSRREPDLVDGGHVRLRQRPTEQVHVALGVRGVSQLDDDRFAVRVLDGLLGGGPSSRLFHEIRETRGLAYSTYSDAATYTDAGLFGAFAGTSPGKVDEVVELMRRELDRVAEDVTPAEVERAKGALTGATILSLEESGSRMVRLGSQAAGGAPIVTVEESLRRIAEVGVEDVRRVAHRLLDRPRSLAVVGPFGSAEVDRFAAAVA